MLGYLALTPAPSRGQGRHVFSVRSLGLCVDPGLLHGLSGPFILETELGTVAGVVGCHWPPLHRTEFTTGHRSINAVLEHADSRVLAQLGEELGDSETAQLVVFRLQTGCHGIPSLCCISIANSPACGRNGTCNLYVVPVTMCIGCPHKKNVLCRPPSATHRHGSGPWPAHQRDFVSFIPPTALDPCLASSRVQVRCFGRSNTRSTCGASMWQTVAFHGSLVPRCNPPVNKGGRSSKGTGSTLDLQRQQVAVRHLQFQLDLLGVGTASAIH